MFAILALAFLLRLYHIDFPIAGWHSWRQADTAAMARNFYENGFDLLYPQIDWGGNSSGVVESEFPIYSFFVSILYAMFGVSDTWGRILSLLCALATIYGLYILVRKYLSSEVALWSAFIYAILPLNIYYGRAFMPESAMLMCSVLGIYSFSQWLDDRKITDFILSWLFISLAILLKIPTLYLGLPLVYLAWLRFRRSTFTSGMLWIYAAAVILPVALWYYHAHQLFLHSGLSFGIWGFGTDKWGNFDIILTPKFYNDVFFKSIAERHLTYAGFIPFVTGFFIKRTSTGERLFDYWLLAVVIYFLIVARGNQVHEYYQLPFVLPAVVYVGKTLSKYLPLGSFRGSFKAKPLPPSFFLLCLIGVLVLSYLRYDRFMNSETLDSSLFRLASSVHGVTKKDDLIVAVNEGNPTVLYRCNRKGWNSSVEQLDSTFLGARAREGAKYLVGETTYFDSPERMRTLNRLLTNHRLVTRGNDYFVIGLWPEFGNDSPSPSEQF
jgi:4-amino-4-deoxy-L-arabinose transferase-like glycosyltransferase